MPSLPLAYNTPAMDKVLILMTDGENSVADSTQGAPGTCTVSACTSTTPKYQATTDSDYTSYGRIAENRLGLPRVSRDTYGDEFDRRTSVLCERIKATGITVYTVTFALSSSATRTLFRNCATKPEYYFNSPDGAALRAAFREIAGQLANLRLTQ